MYLHVVKCKCWFSGVRNSGRRKCWLSMSTGWFTFNDCKSHCFGRDLQRYYSPADWARELFKPFTDSASLPVQTKKMFFFVLGVGFSLGDVIIRACFHPCSQVYPALGTNPMGHFLKSRLSSRSLEPLTGLLAYLEPKLLLKKQKRIKILHSQVLTWAVFRPRP